MSNGADGTSGIISRAYKSGSIIYFEGDKSEYIYILKTGRVMLTSTKLDTGEEVKEDVRQGEFFGVKSALGRYPREETAQTAGDTSVLVLTVADFERLILRNVNVVRKMLRVFSNQLRRIGKMQRSILGDNEDINPEVELFKIGEYYYKNGVLNHAEYAYKKYMEYYPDAQHAKLAMDRIRAIGSGQSYSDFAAPSDSKPVKKPAAEDGMDDFTFDDGADEKPARHEFEDDDFSAERAPASGARGSDLASEMDDFLSDSKDAGLDDFSFDEPAETLSIAESFKQAQTSQVKSNFNGASKIYQDIVDQDNVRSDSDKKLQERSHVELGYCLFKSGKVKEGMETLGNFLRQNSRSEHAKRAFLYAGEILASAGQRDKAITYLTKALNMPPKDDLSKQAFEKIKKLQNG